MKKIIAVFIAVSAVLSMSACMSQPEENVKNVSQAVLEHYRNDEAYYDYKTEQYTFRVPLYWKGKILTDITENREDFYLQSAYNTDETGLAFSIIGYKNKKYKKEHENYGYLGYSKKNKLHYVLVTPAEDLCPEADMEEYQKLKGIAGIVKNTFVVEE